MDYDNENDIVPLTSQQQIFLQRFLANHVLTDNEAQSLYQNILLQSQQSQQSQQGNQLGSDLNDTLSRINQSLKPAFRLEIRSVSLASPFTIRNNHNNDTSDDDDENNDSSSSSRGQIRPIIYHTIVNCDPDDVAKFNANPTFTKSPHELAFFRLILERLIEKDTSSSSSSNSDSTTQSTRRGGGRHGSSGCNAYMSRMDMINLRLDLTGAHKDKLNITQVEHVVDLLETQGWLVPAHVYSEDIDAAAAAAASLTQDSSSGRRPRRNVSSDSGNKASKYLQIGPRSYLEFPDFLINAGLDKDQLPQFILH